MAIFKNDIVDIDLNTGSVHRSFLNHTIGSGDELANRFGVRLFRKGIPVSAEACTVTAVFMAPDGARYAITETSYPGSTGRSGNEAFVQLPGACYAVEGQFSLVIKLVSGEINGTMRIVDGIVCETGETGAVVPMDTIPTTTELIAAYEQAIEFVSSCVRIDVDQGLTSEQKQTARQNIGAAKTEDVEIVRESVYSGYRNYLIDKSMLTEGIYNRYGYGIVASTTFIRTITPIFLKAGSYVWIKSGHNAERMYIGKYDPTGAYIGEESFTPSGTNTYFAAYDQNVIIAFKTFSSVAQYNGEVYFAIPESGDIKKPFVINGTTGASGTSYYFAASTNRLRMVSQIRVHKNDAIRFTAGTNVNQMYCEIIDGDTFAPTGKYSDWVGNGSVYVAPVDGLMTVLFRNSGNAAITPDDFDASVAMVSANPVHIAVELEYGYYKSDANRTYGSGISSFFSSKINKLFIDAGGAVAVSLPESYTSADTYVLFFAADQTFISSAQFAGISIKTPANCKYIGINTNITTLSEADVTLYGCSYAPKTAKRTARCGTFPENATDAVGFVVKDSNFSIMHFMLPSNYTIDGAPVPLIVWMRGSSGTSTWAEDFGDTYQNPNLKTYLCYLRDEGFAVCTMHTWGSYYANKYGLGVENASPYATPTCMEAFKNGIEYMCSRYNVDASNVHLLGHSQGGQLQTYCVTNPIVPLKSICMFAPVNDYLSMPGDSLYYRTRRAIAEDLSLTGDTDYFGSTNFSAYSTNGIAFLSENKERIALLNEAWTGLVGDTLANNFNQAIEDGSKFWEGGTSHPALTDIYTHYEYIKMGQVPVKIWAAADDTATPYQKMVEIVKQWQNGGCEATLRTLPNNTGGHGAPLYGSVMQESVTTKTGVVYSNLPVSWHEAVQFMRTHMAKTA